MSDDVVNIEVDGEPVEAKKGQMIIQVTDRIGAYIPRFCYHDKLSIAANCRMCLVEVEKAPKPLPACATPVMEGMKVFTRSPAAIAAQKATMEFLLINHPLDCPICDQGGECELQDQALGYGRDVSRYSERKRVVKDKDIGPLVSTDMTRCIHCTRCVRFGQEITGQPQLGTTERGENMKIGTYVEQSIDHELSANIIDLCPVGALNNKPYRYSARAWEMTQKPAVAPHDCVGSNMYAHVLRGTIKRIVPRDNEALNETWLSDRDRFSYEGIYSSERLLRPRLKSGDDWEEVSWDEALNRLASELKEADGKRTGILASPSATVEEAHLLARLAEYLGTVNLDHRVRRRDFSAQADDPVFPWLGCDIADLESADGILVVGSNLRKEVPIIAHRIRKAALKGAKVSLVNHRAFEYFFDLHAHLHNGGLVEQLAGIAVAAAGSKDLPKYVRALCKGVAPSEDQHRIAQSLADADSAHILTGLVAGRHRASSAIQGLVSAIAEATGASTGTISEGANSAGAHIAGLLPQRKAGGIARGDAGLDAAAMLEADLDSIFLFGLEPDDLACHEAALDRLADTRFVVALTAYSNADLEQAANLMLPIGTFAETSGTFVNCEGRWQSFAGIANPVGEARPGWKVLRVLGNLVDAEGFDYVSSEDVLAELKALVGDVKGDNSYRGSVTINAPNGADSPDDAIDVPIYKVDPVVRRAIALQMTAEAQRIEEGQP
jgi:NADH-quinone oxidoreductase subunit G